MFSVALESRAASLEASVDFPWMEELQDRADWSVSVVVFSLFSVTCALDLSLDGTGIPLSLRVLSYLRARFFHSIAL